MNPRAGGAEAVSYEIARRLVQAGDSVEWFSASFKGSSAEETRDGVRFVRAGRQWSVHWSAFRHYRTSLAQDFDVVIDEVNTIPFFTPVWATIPTVMFIHQLAREVWWYESPFPLNALGYLAEPRYLTVYRRVPVLTVSRSTQADLLRLNFQGPIVVIPQGREPIALQQVPKSTTPTFLFVGRLAPSKRVEHAIRALALFNIEGKGGVLRIVGDGSLRYRRALERLVARLGVEDKVDFLGRVPASEKHHLMAESHALLMTSVREGWGLAVSEANACGTPAIVYDVPGLRDSVRNQVTGLVVPPRPEKLRAAMRRLTSDSNLYARLSTECARWANSMSFDDTARLVRDTLQQALTQGVTSPTTPLSR